MKLEALKKVNFHCTFCECHKQSWLHNSNWIGYKNAPRPSNAFIMICTDMKMKFRFSGEKEFIAGKGDIVFVPKGQHYTVSFFNSDNRFDSYTANFLLNDTAGNELAIDDEEQIFKGALNKIIISATEDFFKAYLCRENNQIRKMASFYLWMDAVLHAISCDSHCYCQIESAVELLVDEWNKNNRMEYYAQWCGMDKSYFYKLFKHWSGYSPNQYRNMIRITAAKDLLLNTNLPVAEISRKIGFYDPYYFSRIFKKEVGISPANYRKSRSF